MGLDQYCIAQTSVLEPKQVEAAYGGHVAIRPMKDKGHMAIGYWRKAYAVDTFIREHLKSYRALPINEYGWRDDNCVPMRMLKPEINAILEEAKQQIQNLAVPSTTISDDARERIRRDWENTKNIMTLAMEILDKDRYAKIYYWIWY